MRKLLVLLLLCSSLAMAKSKQAPLPDKLASARTVYIDNQSGYANIGDEVYSELSDWPRFQIVSSRDAADAIVRLTVTSPLNASNRRFTQMDVISKSGDVLWTDSRAWGFIHGAAKELAKEFRKRVSSSAPPPAAAPR